MHLTVLSRSTSIYTTRRLVEAARERGVGVRVMDPLDVEMGLGDGPALYWRRKKFPRTDVVVPRIGLSVHQYGLSVVNQLELMGIPVLNGAYGIGASRNKMRSLQLLAAAGVHGIVAQKEAECRVMGGCRYAPDRITGIEVFQIHRQSGFLEVSSYGVPQENADVPETYIARCIPLVVLTTKVLARAFSYHDNRVSPKRKPLSEGGQETFKGKGDFRDETEVHVVVGQNGESGDKTRLSAHELYQADSVSRPRSLVMGRIRYPGRFGYGRLEAERLLNKGYIVIYGFRNTDHRDLQASPCNFSGDSPAPPESPVAADNEQDTDVHVIEGIHHFGHILWPP